MSGILPRGDNNFPNARQDASFVSAFNSVARDVNERLRDVERVVPWVKFVNHEEFTDSNGRTRRHMLSRDGLHLSPEGTMSVASRLEHELIRDIDAPRRTVSTKELTPRLNDRPIIGPMTLQSSCRTSTSSRNTTSSWNAADPRRSASTASLRNIPAFSSSQPTGVHVLVESKQAINKKLSKNTHVVETYRT